MVFPFKVWASRPVDATAWELAAAVANSQFRYAQSIRSGRFPVLGGSGITLIAKPHRIAMSARPVIVPMGGLLLSGLSCVDAMPPC
jgi:hypothetical protein